jgi:hypothetical protein
MKQLLESEGIVFEGDKIKDFDKYVWYPITEMKV